MTPAEFKSARRALGLSAEGMARTLGVSAGRTIRKWESGENDIPGPAIVAVTYMMQGVPDATIRSVLPEHLIGDDAEGEIDREILVRLHRPRFVAWVLDRQPSAEIDSIETFPGSWLAVGLWIDDPAGFEVAELLFIDSSSIEIYTADSFED